MKKVFFLLLLFLSSFLSVHPIFAADLVDPTDIIPDQGSAAVFTPGEGFDGLDTILGFARDSIFNLMMLIAVGVFLFIGGRLAVARGNPEEFKKSMWMFVYAIVGIVLVSASYAIIKLVVSLKL